MLEVSNMQAAAAACCHNVVLHLDHIVCRFGYVISVVVFFRRLSSRLGWSPSSVWQPTLP